MKTRREWNAGQPKKFLPFETARAIARGRALRHKQDWDNWRDRPNDIPSAPNRTYKGDWLNWPDWLGTKTKPVARRRSGPRVKFLPFEQARKIVQTFHLKGVVEWRTWAASSERPPNIPTHPNSAYKGKGWIDFKHWLGPVIHPQKYYIRGVAVNIDDFATLCPNIAKEIEALLSKLHREGVSDEEAGRLLMEFCNRPDVLARVRK